MDHDGAGILVRVDVPDLRSQTRVIINRMDPVGFAKQAVLDKLSHDWPIDVANNYGFYIPPSGGRKVGRFLDESRPLVDEHITITHLELQYKRRDYSGTSLSEKALVKANSKSNTKKLIDYVTSGSSIKKAEKLLDGGLDPNFIMEDGNTPLGVVCGRNGRADLIQPLIAGGAHIDFRGVTGLTPIHRAAIGGNVQAMKTLLSLGASPNYIDSKGLTPLYHACIMGDDIAVCESLLKYNAFVGNTDNIGWTELHQIAKHGYVYMIDVMLLYGADINALNKAGNTPLHVAAQHGQLEVAIHLMERGANRSIQNASKQPPNQVAILCGHHRLAKEIQDFDEIDIDVIESKKKQRHSFGEGSHVDHTVQPTAYSSKTLPSKKKPETSLASAKPIKTSATTQVPSLSTSPPSKQAPPPPVISVGSKRSKPTTIQSTASGSSPETSLKNNSPRGRRYSNDRKKSSPSPSPVLAKSPSPTGEVRERLYPIAQPAKTYIANTNVDPLIDGDLPLTKGALVEVLYIGKGGYWEGRSQGIQGWFPQDAISQKLEDEEELPPLPPLESRPLTAETLENKSGIKVINIRRGDKGFGFAMRGIKAVNMSKFKPSPHVPALQYVARIDKGSSAEVCGLLKGDFIIEVNGVNTTYSTHEEVVGIIKQSDSALLKLKVITPISSQQKQKSTTSKSSDKSTSKEDLRTEHDNTSKNTTASKLQAGQRLSQDSEDEIKSQRKISSLATVSQSMTPPSGRPTTNQVAPVSQPSPKQNKLTTNNAPTADPLLSTEELLKKEKDSYRKLMEEEEKDSKESLSPFAQQLRKASQDHFKRSAHTSLPTKNDNKPVTHNPNPVTKDTSNHREAKHDDHSETHNDGDKYNTAHGGNIQSDNEEDDWEYTETLTNYNEITAMPIADSHSDEAPKRYILDSSPSNNKRVTTTSSPKVTASKLNQSPQVSPKQDSSISTSSSPKIGLSSKRTETLTSTGGQSPLSKPKNDHPSTSSYKPGSPLSSKSDYFSSPKKDHPSSTGSPKKDPPSLTGFSSPKKDHLSSTGFSSPKKDHLSSTGFLSPKKDHPLSTAFSSPKKDSPLSVKKESPLLPKRDISYSSPKKDPSNTSPKAPPPVIKPKPSYFKDTTPSTTIQPSSSSVSSQQQFKGSPLTKPTSSGGTRAGVSNNEKDDKVVEQPATQPFTSLKDKFEKLAQTEKQSPLFVKRRQPKPISKVEQKREETKATAVAITTNKDEREEDALPPPVLDDVNSNRFSVISFEDLPLPPDLLDEIDKEKEENSDQQLPPPAPLPPVENDAMTLPPPATQDHLDDELDHHDDEPSFTLPPPLMSDSDNEDDLPLPAVYNNKEKHKPNLLKESVPSLPPPMTSDEGTFESVNNEGDLLNNIVGQLVKLTNNDDDSEEEDSDSDSLPPPPLPSRPPPDSDEEEEEENTFNKPPSLTTLEEPQEEPSLMDEFLPPPPVEVDDQEEDVIIPAPFEEEESLPPPPLVDEEEEFAVPPPSFEEDTVPPPFEDDDLLPPPFEEEESNEDTLPSFEDTELPPPPLSQEEEEEDATFLPPPPPPDQADFNEETNTSELESDDLLPPPPLPPPQLDESYEYEETYNDDSLIPPPLELSEDEDESLSQETESEEEEEDVPVSSWSVDQVCKWLDEIGLSMYRETFQSNEIIGEHLIDLSRDDLKDLGITKVGHIKTLRQKLQERLKT